MSGRTSAAADAAVVVVAAAAVALIAGHFYGIHRCGGTGVRCDRCHRCRLHDVVDVDALCSKCKCKCNAFAIVTRAHKGHKRASTGFGVQKRRC